MKKDYSLLKRKGLLLSVSGAELAYPAILSSPIIVSAIFLAEEITTCNKMNLCERCQTREGTVEASIEGRTVWFCYHCYDLLKRASARARKKR